MPPELEPTTCKCCDSELMPDRTVAFEIPGNFFYTAESHPAFDEPDWGPQKFLLCMNCNAILGSRRDSLMIAIEKDQLDQHDFLYIILRIGGMLLERTRPRES